MKVLIHYCARCHTTHPPDQPCARRSQAKAGDAGAGPVRSTHPDKTTPASPEVRQRARPALKVKINTDPKKKLLTTAANNLAANDTGDGVALTSMAMPPGVLEKSAAFAARAISGGVVLTAEGIKAWQELKPADQEAFRNGTMFRKLLEKRAKSLAIMRKLRNKENP